MPAGKSRRMKNLVALIAFLSAAAVWACDDAGEDLPDSATTSGTPSSTPLPSAAPTTSTAAPTPSAAPAAIPTEQPTAAPVVLVPTATAPSSDRVYADPETGMSLSYPSRLSVGPEQSVELSAGDKAPATTMRIVSFKDGAGVTGLDLGLTGNPSSLSAVGWMDAYDPCLADYDPNLPQRYSTTVGGYDAVVCPVDQLNQQNPRAYVTVGGTRL